MNKTWPLLLWSTGVWAQGALPDPTRPPVAAAPIAESGKAAAGPAAGGLSSVILRKGEKPAAIVDGQYVELGGKVGERRVVRIAEGKVVLRNAEGRETLLLTPGIEKTPVVKEKAGKSSARGAKR